MSKTLGEELYNLLNPYDPSACANPSQWHETDEDFRSHYERCAAKLKNAVIEECAKVAEALEAERREEAVRERGYNNTNVANRLFDQADGALQVAAEIRSLKTSTGEETANE